MSFFRSSHLFGGLITCAMLAVTACSNTPTLNQAGELHPQSNISSSDPLNILTSSRWELIAPLDGSTTSINSELRPAIQFEAATKRFSGNDGCNRIMGDYEANRTSLKFGQMAGTKMACMPGTDRISQTFTEALSRTTAYRFESDYLILLNKNGDKLLTLRKAGSDTNQ